MSKVRIPVNPKQVGKVGAYSMYVRDGEQIVRQRQNASNYGEEASRTLSQQTRRVKWSNLVSLFKYMSDWQPRAYENLNKGQTDYNKFMSLNINSASVALTKQQSADGAAVVAPVVVSQGSLVSPDAIEEGSHNISVGMAWGTGDTASFATIGELSEALVQNNAGWQDGDNLAAIYFLNWLDIQGTPRCSSVYAELTLDKTNTSPLSSNPLASRMTFTAGGMGIDIAPAAADFNDVRGWAVIHTRRDSGSLKVSTERIIIVDDDILSTFITTAQLEAAIESYGLSTEVPLEPSFKKAVIDYVAVDGSRVLGPKGGRLEYDHEITLTIVGKGMTPETVWLVHNDIPYTPLTVEGDTWTYVLGSNGVNAIWLNGVLYARVTVSGIIMPEGLPSRFQVNMVDDEGVLPGRDVVVNYSTDCINYPHILPDGYDSFLLNIGSSGSPVSGVESDLTVVNGSVTSFAGAAASFRANITPDDPQTLCYVKFKGYIVLVCNYE